MGVGIKELTKKESFFTLYPNPTTDYINVKLVDENNNSPKNIKIYNQLGEIVESLQLNKTNTTFNMAQLKQGVYYISITSKNKNYGIQKFIKY